MAIVPDTKNWTWVLERPCPECGLDTRAVAPTAVAAMLRENASEWDRLLGSDTEEALRRRPSEDRWSTLEYACHVRDVFRLFDERLGLMLTVDDASFANWDQDATAVTDRYGEQEPAIVGGELVTAASALADRFDAVAGEQWQRTGTRSDGSRFTVESFARYLIHDPVHHLWDVRPETAR